MLLPSDSPVKPEHPGAADAVGRIVRYFGTLHDAPIALRDKVGKK